MISFKLTGVDETLAVVTKAKKEVKKNTVKLLKALVASGLDIVNVKIREFTFPYETGTLKSSIKGIFDEKNGRGIILADTPHAVFVEYGTGVKGARSPHPEPALGWAYDVNNHGDDGWWYLGIDGFHWTKGMPSRPFMYNACQELKRELPRIAKEVFGK